ncbi:MAG: sulfotransferase [Thioploca sp.]|nr:sulfotransferase [Thioploca sp.]
MKLNLIKHDIRSVGQEMRSYLRVLLKKDRLNNKFVIFGQGRTGSNLVRTLLQSHPQIICRGELFLRYYLKVFMPKLFLQGQLAKCPSNKVYGFQLQPVHLSFHQVDSKAFLSYLHNQGWKIIYLKRKNWLHQKISAMIAIRKNKWHYQASDAKTDKSTKIHLNSNDLIKELEKKGLDYTKDKEMLESLPYIEIIYEDDLLTAEQHQSTADKIFAYLNLASAPVKTSLQKTPYKISEVIENYEEIATLLSQTQYAPFLKE